MISASGMATVEADPFMVCEETLSKNVQVNTDNKMNARMLTQL